MAAVSEYRPRFELSLRATREEILASYPTLKAEHIDAAVAYAAELAHEESLLSVTAL